MKYTQLLGLLMMVIPVIGMIGVSLWEAYCIMGPAFIWTSIGLIAWFGTATYLMSKE